MSDAQMWGLGDYGRFAERLSPVHDALVAALRPTSRQTWLDVATGTGGVALRAARAGARVTAVDVTRSLIDSARAQAIGEGLELELVEADARELPFQDGAFDVVTSCFGFGFDREEADAHSELVRVCRGGGSIGIVVWRPDAGLNEALRPVTGRTGTAYESSTPERAHEVLDASFDVETSIRIWHNRDESPEAMYEFLASSNPPIVAYLQGVDDDQRERFRRALVDYWRSFSSDCGVCVPSEYLIVTGKKR